MQLFTLSFVVSFLMAFPSIAVALEPDNNGVPGSRNYAPEETGYLDPKDSPCKDVDGDGFIDWECGGDDCSDVDPNIYPDAEEVCDGLDNDCDGLTDENAVPELCDDGVDNDCDGLTDEVEEMELCGNGVDNDCDGLIDENDPDCCECTPGETRTCGISTGECRPGIQNCEPTCSWGKCLNAIDPQPEVCDGMDNDCDGRTDDLGTLACGTGLCLTAVTICVNGEMQECIPTEPLENNETTCDDKEDNDCDGFTDQDDLDCGCTDSDNDGFTEAACGGRDCNDTKPDIHPDALEDCDDQIDNDCDGATDLADEDCEHFSVGGCDCKVPGAKSQAVLVSLFGILLVSFRRRRERILLD